MYHCFTSVAVQGQKVTRQTQSSADGQQMSCTSVPVSSSPLTSCCIAQMLRLLEANLQSKPLNYGTASCFQLLATSGHHDSPLIHVWQSFSAHNLTYHTVGVAANPSHLEFGASERVLLLFSSAQHSLSHKLAIMAALLAAAEGLTAAASTSRPCDAPSCCHSRRSAPAHQPSRPQLSTRRAQISRHSPCCRRGASQQSVRCFAAPGSLQERASDERTGSFGEAYSVGELLGMGSFGKVYRAISRTDPGTGYAVKIVPKHREGVLDERIARRIHEEVCRQESRSRSGVRCHIQGARLETDACCSSCRWGCSDSCSRGQRQCGWRECMRCALTPPHLVPWSTSLLVDP